MSIRLGYAIIYVDSVVDALDFYERAFGLERSFLHESGDFGQLQTGETFLAFTSHRLGATVVPVPYARLDPAQPPAGFELTLTTSDVDGAFRTAVDAGATPLSAPRDEPWGQRVSYVRDPLGVLIGIATPI